MGQILPLVGLAWDMLMGWMGTLVGVHKCKGGQISHSPLYLKVDRCLDIQTLGSQQIGWMLLHSPLTVNL